MQVTVFSEGVSCMKSLTSMFSLLLCLLLAGCGQAPDPSPAPSSDTPDAETAAPSADAEIADPWGLSLSAEDVSPTGLTLVFSQSGGSPTGELQTGSFFSLETKTDDVWEPVPLLVDEETLAWDMVAYGIASNDTTTLETSWSYLYGSLSPGVYRISKEVMDYRGPGDYDTQDYSTVFAIVNE